MKTALLVLNMQNDYCEYCNNYKCYDNNNNDNNNNNNSFSIIPIINSIRDRFDYVIYVKDWYPKNHVRFTQTQTKAKIACIQNTAGAEINSGLIIKDTDFIIHKGTLELHDSESAFYNAKLIGKESNLNNIIRENNIQLLYFCGILPEHIILSTVIDAIRFKYKSTIIRDLCVGLDSQKIERCYNYLRSSGVNIIESKDVL
jgi:nicotinamidase/pyrazinamidase